LGGEQIVNLISTGTKYLIKLKLINNPMPGYSPNDLTHWETMIPIDTLLIYMKTLVTHGQQSNDSIVQAALKKIKFDINIDDEKSIDDVVLHIYNTLVLDLPTEIKQNMEYQRVMMKGLMAKLNKSHPPLFCQDVHNHILGKGKEINSVETFNQIFNQFALELIKGLKLSKRYSSNDESSHKNNSSNPNKRVKGEKKEYSGTGETRHHCNGCGRSHKPPCQLTWKAEYNTDTNTPYAQSRAGKEATARLIAEGKPAKTTLDMSYRGPNEVAPADNPFASYSSSSSSHVGGRGRGRDASSGKDYVAYDTKPLYLTTLTNDSDCHLLPLLIKVAEEDGQDVDVDGQDNNQPSTHSPTDITRSNSQSLNETFPVNILLDTGSLGPDGNYIHQDIVSIIDPLGLHTKRSTNSVCSGLNNDCIANNSYLFVTVMITKLILITIKC
jgi:hypothetical protein